MLSKDISIFFSVKLPLSQKLRNFINHRSCLSQCLNTIQLSIARYQVQFYANNYFEYLLIVPVSLGKTHRSEGKSTFLQITTGVARNGRTYSIVM